MRFAKLLLISASIICILSLSASPALSDVTKNANVTAAVPARSSDLLINVSMEGSSPIPQDSEQTFKISYGSDLSYATSMTLTAYWGQGIIEGDSAPSLDIVDYVIGSTTNGINSTVPVINTTNHSITWTFSSFPANTTGSVDFKLKTNSSYKEPKKVNFEVRALFSTGSVSASSSISPYYLYGSAMVSTPTLTPSATITPTPTLTQQPFSIENVQIRNISERQAQIYVQTSKPSKLFIFYGLAPSLNKLLVTNNFVSPQIITLQNLKPNQEYFFKIQAQSENKEIVNSDIFNFRTSVSPSIASVNPSSFVVVSGNNVIFDTVGNTATQSALNNLVIIPQNTTFQFKFSLSKSDYAQNIKLVLRKVTGKTVLGENTLNFAPYANAASVSVLEFLPGVYSVSLNSNIEAGIYQLLTSFRDKFGNLTEQNVGLVKITNPFTVINNGSKPVEGARVFLYIYDENKKIYIPLSSSQLNIENPLFTNSMGVVNFTLPKGRYKAAVTNLGYKDKTVKFNLLESENSSYPIIRLEKGPITIFSLIRYYWRGFNDVFITHFVIFVGALATSVRFFDLISGLTLLILVMMTLYAFLRKNNIEHLFSYIIYLSNHLFKGKANQNYINGIVKDKNGGAIFDAIVYLIDGKNQEVVATAKTDKHGEFFFKKGHSTYYISAMKKGFISAPEIKVIENEFIEYEMEKSEITEKIVANYLRTIIQGLLSISFELLLITTIFFELIFVGYFGIEKIAPFLLISLFNIVVWVLRLYHIRRRPTKIS